MQNRTVGTIRRTMSNLFIVYKNGADNVYIRYLDDEDEQNTPKRRQ